MIVRSTDHPNDRKTILIIYSDVERYLLKQKIKEAGEGFKVKINEPPCRYLKGVMIIQNF